MPESSTSHDRAWFPFRPTGQGTAIAYGRCNASTALAPARLRRPRTRRRAFCGGLHPPLYGSRRCPLDLRGRPDELAFAHHAVMGLASALDLIEELAVVVRQLAHDLIFGGWGGSLVKSGNEVDFLANAEFMSTHTGRERIEIDAAPYRVPCKLPSFFKALDRLPRGWLRPGRRRSGPRACIWCPTIIWTNRVPRG